jgi:hypothetical protein
MRNLSIFISLVFLLPACKKEKLSGDVNILNYSVVDLSRHSFILDRVFIDESNRTISLLFANYIPPDSLPLSFTANFSLPAGATSIPVSGEIITINSIDEQVKYTITAEDGSQVDYFVMLRDNQLPDSGFEDWYTAIGMNGSPFKEPGKSAKTTIWATANNGTSIYGVYGTQPVVSGSNTIVQITTGETSPIPIIAGTLFTGKFDINGAINHPTDPKKATLFGIPFSLRPVAIKFMYAFQPGNRYIQATLKNPTNIFGGFNVTDIPGEEDMFTAYAILEKRDGSDILEVGRAEIISGELQDVLKEITLPFNYSSAEKPTHISVVFASSKDGDLYKGAAGSILTVDDVELVY